MNRTPIFAGDRVSIAPHTDLFMRGERFATAEKIGRKYVTVRGERSGRTFRFPLNSDGIESLAPRVTLNAERRLYVIRESYGYSCLGFDVCDKRVRGYAAWIERQGAPLEFSAANIAAPGSLELYAQYESAVAAISRIYRATGARCDAELTPELRGLEGKRVEVVDRYGETRRFIVGKSTGWIPCHLEISSARSQGGGAVTGAPFRSVRVIG